MKKLQCVIFFCFCLFCLFLKISFAQNIEGYKNLETSYLNVLYKDIEDIKYINRTLRVKQDILLNYKYGYYPHSFDKKIKLKLDAVFFQVEQLLDMYPKKGKINFKLIQNVSEFKDIYFNFYRREFKNAKGKSKIFAFYRFKDNTIYMYYRHITIGVLAHEMAHSIISNYFVIVPPIKTQEILAMYVDNFFSN